MGHNGLRVFHMQYATASGGVENQVHEIQPGEEVEAIILEMVGDLAAYRPGAKVVFFEGEDSEFDLSMVSRLFPVFRKGSEPCFWRQPIQSRNPPQNFGT